MSDWSLIYEGYEPGQEGLREALCTLGNGYFTTRGASPDSSADDIHYPGTYIAGGYNRAVTKIQGREVENEDLVNFPNWLSLTFRVDGGDWFGIDQVDVLDYRQELNLRDGLLYRLFRFRDGEGRTTKWAERRLVSMANPHLSALSVELTPEDWQGRIEVRSALDGTVINSGVARYRDLEGRHLEILAAERISEGMIFLRSRTRQSRLEVAQVARTRVYRSDQKTEVERRTEERAGWIAELLSVDVAASKRLCIEKIVCLYTSRDRAIAEPGVEAQEDARRVGRFDEVLDDHRRSWSHRWDDFDLELELAHDSDEADAQLKLRLNVFHLLQTVSPHSIELDVGVPARGWHGEAYRGHIFWDELFIFPLLSLRSPDLTRAVLLYRYRRLPEARRAAQQAGLLGAMFPWQSGSNGREESQKLHLNPKSGRWLPDTSHRQRHINSAIAHNIWRYYQVTDDYSFLYYYGAEMMLEIARFWASIATYNAELDRYEILGVMGPDEYHTAYPDTDPEKEGGLDNNAYTNLMAAWVLTRARDALDLLPEQLSRKLRGKLGLNQEEIEQWERISRKLRICFHGDRIISQFEGYDELEELDWEHYREKYGDIQRLDRILEAEGDTTNRYKASKQADVLMLFYLFSAQELELLFEQLGYPWDPELIPRQIEYYCRRTSHGSTLSRVTHAWVLARSDRPASWKLCCEALDSDIADIQGGTTPEGIHTGAMAGTVDLMQRCYTGVETRAKVLYFNPQLPRDLRYLRLRFRYRRQLLDVEITQQTLSIASRSFTGLPIAIAYRGHYRDLAPGERYQFTLIPSQEREREIREEESHRLSRSMPRRRDGEEGR
jgi:alpha,alpha-trehalase